MNLIRTDRTYATQVNAMKALDSACKKIGKTISSIRYVIAVDEQGRFAPAVVGELDCNGESNNPFMFVGITWVN